MLKFLNISDFLIGICSRSETPQQMCNNNIIFFIQYETFYRILQIKAYICRSSSYICFKTYQMTPCISDKKSIKNTYFNNFKR